MWITLVQNLSHNFSFFIIFLPSVQNRQILSKSPPFKASGLTRCSLRQSRNDHHPTWISLIKDTSLAYIVGVGELTFLATQVNNRSMVYPMEVFLFVALVYFVFCLALDLLANAVNRRFGAQTRALKRSWRWWRNKPPLPAS